MSGQFRQTEYGYDTYGPDMDSEFTFGPRSIYVEEMSKDGVSEFTDYNTVRTDDFDPVGGGGGVYRKGAPPPAPPQLQQQRPQQFQRPPAGPGQRPPGPPPGPPGQRQPGPPGQRPPAPGQRPGPPPQQQGRAPPPPPQRADSRRTPPPPSPRPADPRRTPPPGLSQSRSSSRRSNMEEPEPEMFTDEHEVYRPASPAKQSKFVAHVGEWFNQIEEQGNNDDEEEGRRSLVQQQDKRPDDRIQTSREKRMRALVIRLCLACSCLFFVSAVAAFLFVYLFLIKGDDDKTTTRDAVLTPAPTMPPAPPPTPAPTPSAPTTSMPTPGELDLVLIENLQGPTSYGTTVAMEEGWLAVGAPSNGGGKVSTQFNDGAIWKYIVELEADTNDAFGASLDLIKPANDVASLLVGSPDAGTNSEGTATLYRYVAAHNHWEAQGARLAGEPTSTSVAEKFGTSLALSENLRAVVGAPEHDANGGLSGRIYTYQYRLVDDIYEALPMVYDEPLYGRQPSARLGTDVDITKDGSLVAAGEPGANSFSIYHYDGTLWLKVFEATVASAPEFGSAVAFLSSEYVAVGSPSSSSTRGMIRVYKKGSGLAVWDPLPDLIGGTRGDRLGTTNTISGQVGDFGPELVVGTGNGAVERYDLIGNLWVRRYQVNRNSAVTAIASNVEDDGDDYTVFAGHGSGREARLYAGQARTIDNPSPTSAPATAAPTPSPTPNPTAAPTQPLSWQRIGGPFLTDDTGVNTRYGHDVALVGDFVAVGEPNGRTSDGAVVIRERPTSWGIDQTGFAAGSRQFGYSVDAGMVGGTPSLLVGATETKDDGDFAQFGSAHFYQRDNSGNWNAVGTKMMPAFAMHESGGKFGSSVAMATDVLRVAVGAPLSSVSDEMPDTGRVYTFEHDGSDWQQMAPPLIGGDKNVMLGGAVDMSKDGQRMLVGSPGHRGGDGAMFYMEWNSTSTTWNKILSLAGSNGSKQALGTTVAIITDNAKWIAFGGPQYGNDQGVIKIWEELPTIPGFFNPVGGEDIVGSNNDRIGTTLAGAQGRVAFGTEAGAFHVYEYVGNAWTQIATGPSLGSPVVSISMSDDGRTVAVGLENENVVVYELQ